MLAGQPGHLLFCFPTASLWQMQQDHKAEDEGYPTEEHFEAGVLPSRQYPRESRAERFRVLPMLSPVPMVLFPT